MVQVRNRNVPKEGNETATVSAKATRTAKTTEPQQPPAGRKRKAEESEEETKANRPSTPPPAKVTKTGEPEQKIITTPGRIGPIKKTSRDCEPDIEPDIKPFKGPPGKKVRKTYKEKDDEYKNSSSRMKLTCSISPNGSPTYDKAGFELDYKKVADWMKPQVYNKSAMIRGMDKAVNKAMEATKRMAEIFFEKGEAPEDPSDVMAADYWKDRVSKDLNIPWHKVGVAEFEQWDKMGFKKARRGEYENFTQEERDRMLDLMECASLRK
ncbi:hypothetical protein BP5796_02835 [Coleophoma crateriformis]|uniref:Uncharacterized protein n=1 Tax=Coleophoma crateriformis TaxID=565419 RepID=A0A3D8SZF9_9HELO|nr:hypothetical protein BP5796_02835 [Coleophoma crateriformis]